ncbi:MAG: ATP-binding cassette domain-containing protein [Phycisphaera sp.]|nr:ATP-binding cassette domain-containing protein [Phycisphaera sp.]
MTDTPENKEIDDETTDDAEESAVTTDADEATATKTDESDESDAPDADDDASTAAATVDDADTEASDDVGDEDDIETPAAAPAPAASTSSGEHVVYAENLTKQYGDFTALDSLNLSLEKGQILGFIGPNGAGKTTTIKILVGLARPTSGKASIAGHDCTRDVKQIKRLVGYMPDVFGAYDNMRVHEYLDFFGAAFKIPQRDRAKRIGEVMDITGTAYMHDLYVEALSHGMKQRVGIARTLLHDPTVLILDEPANGLDPAARIDMRQILLRLAEMGKTLIVTSHILPELSRICDVVAIITNGKLRAFGTLDQIMQQVRRLRMMQVTLSDREHVLQLSNYLKANLSADSEVTPSETEAEVRFSTVADDKRLTELLTGAIRDGLSIAQFREVETDLEDAFLEVTGLREKVTERADGRAVN